MVGSFDLLNSEQLDKTHSCFDSFVRFSDSLKHAPTTSTLESVPYVERRAFITVFYFFFQGVLSKFHALFSNLKFLP
jgi:hypothetical protein